MPDSLIFNGTSDKIVFTAGNYSGGDDSSSVVVIAKVSSDGGTFKKFVGIDALDSLFGTNNGSPKKMDYFAGGGAGATASALSVEASDGWTLYAYTLGPVHGTPGRFHKYSWNGGAWFHEDNVASPNNPAVSTITIGCSGDNTQFMDCNMLIAGFWDAELSYPTIETLITGRKAWVAAAPDEAWRFDSMDAIVSLTGTSTQVSRSGTSIDSGDAPPGWLDTSPSDNAALPRIGRGAGW